MQCISPVFVRKTRLSVPCGKCNYCLATKRNEWSFRLQREKKNALTSKFLTLTYDGKSVPIAGHASVYGPHMLTLVKRDLQLFTKRLRKQNATVCDWPVRYYSVGEYGGRFERPHYHSIMFNVHPDTYEQLADIWGLGNVSVYPADDAAIHYVAKYVITRHEEYAGREPPFAMMSKRPGIGSDYLRTHSQWHKTDLRNFTQIHGQVSSLPRYYKDKIFNPLEREALRVSSLDYSSVSYMREIDRLSLLHPDPMGYYEERNRAAHDAITEKVKLKDKF